MKNKIITKIIIKYYTNIISQLINLLSSQLLLIDLMFYTKYLVYNKLKSPLNTNI